MRVNVPSEMMRLVVRLAQRADLRLARSAARNAGTSVHAVRTQEIEGARALRDLQQIAVSGAADQAATSGRRAVR